jgi:hypothetical protein
LAAKRLNIKSIYLQHASVSKRFPPLEHDYIFLDGQASLETYRACQVNDSERPDKFNEKKIFLSGIKKNLKKLNLNKNQIGIAVNRTDNLKASKMLCNNLIELGYNVRFRFHPGTRNSVKVNFLDIFQNQPRFECIDSKHESISEFCGNIFCLIAGNTSTHLEAAICGVVPIYFNNTGSEDQDDFYGYVKKGLSYKANSLQDIILLIDKIKKNQLRINDRVVNYFSSTFKTQWQNKESKIVASHILNISKNVDPKELFGYTNI